MNKNMNSNEEALSLFNRLLEQFHQAGINKIDNLVFVAPGAQYVNHIDTQIFGERQQEKDTSPAAPVKSTPLPPELSIRDRIRMSIALLMEERAGDEPLFNLQGHWQAVYRILVDKGYCRDSDFDGFDAFIRTVMPEKVNKPYSKGSLKQISQTDFVRPFSEWRYDVLTSKTRKPYDRMVAVARRFLEILEQNGL